MGRNFLALSSASIFTKFLNLFVIAYVARSIGAEGYGQLSFAIAIAGYFAMLAGLGLDSHAIREVAREPGTLPQRVNRTTALKLLTMLGAFGLLVIVAVALSKPGIVKILMILSFLSLAIGAFRMNWAFTGLERMQWVALATVLEQVANAVLIVLLVQNPGHLTRVPIVTAVAVAVTGAILYWRYWREFGRVSLEFAMPAWKLMLRESLAMGVSTILVNVYYNFDTVMLSFMRTDEEVGWYNAAYKLILTIVTFRYIVISAIYPRASRLFADSKEQLTELLNKLTRLVVAALVPIGVGGTLLADKIIGLIYGQMYEDAAAPFGILIWSAVLFITNAIFPVVLYAANRQVDETRGLLVAVALNIGLNLFLIPRYGIVGAAWATIAADVLLFVWLYAFSEKLVHLRVLNAIGAPLASATVMGLVVYWIRDASLLVSVSVGMIVYVILLFALRGVTASDLQFLREFLPRRRAGQ